MRRVVVSGMGVINSVAQNCEEYADALRNGKSGISGELPADFEYTSVKAMAMVKEFSMKDYLKKQTFSDDLKGKAKSYTRRTSEAFQYTVAAAMEAFWNAGLMGHTEEDAKRISIVIGGNNISQNQSYKMALKYGDNPEYISPNYALQFFDTNLIGVISDLLQIRGEGITVGGASASSNSAILQGYRMVKYGICDTCLVVGAATDFSSLELQAFCNMGAMGGEGFLENEEEVCRPFDQRHEGFIFGQGSGAIVMESLESAKARKADPLAELCGGAIVLDGNRLSDARAGGEARAMQEAMEDAGIIPDEVDYVNAHGTSTPLGDEVELEAIRTVFRHYQDIWINSTKSMIGHCMYSAAVMEAIAVILQMKEKFIHPNKNLVDPISNDFRFTRQFAVEEEIKTAVSNAFGFGGINTSLVLKRLEELY